MQESHSLEWGFWDMFPGACPHMTSDWIPFCKPQANEGRARFDLLTSFHQGNRSVDEWYNAVQAQVCLAKYPQETANILHHAIFWFFLKDEEYVFKIINDSSIDLQSFLQAKSDNLQRKWRHQRQQCVTSSKLQVTLKLHESI